MQRELKVEKMRKSNPPGEPIGVVIPGSGIVQVDAYHCTVRHQGLFASSSFAVAPGTDENSKEVRDMKDAHFKAAESSILRRIKIG